MCNIIPIYPEPCQAEIAPACVIDDLEATADAVARRVNDVFARIAGVRVNDSTLSVAIHHVLLRVGSIQPAPTA